MQQKVMFTSNVRQKCTHGNMAECELLCVGVATLLRNKYASILRVISRKYILQDC